MQTINGIIIQNRYFIISIKDKSIFEEIVQITIHIRFAQNPIKNNKIYLIKQINKEN